MSPETCLLLWTSAHVIHTVRASNCAGTDVGGLFLRPQRISSCSAVEDLGQHSVELPIDGERSVRLIFEGTSAQWL